MSDTFFATISRMKYIERWALMRCSRRESLSEHSLDVAMIAHALCTIGNVRLGKNLNGERAALIGLYHDAAEIITGDMPTPVKYGNPDMKTAYAETERQARQRLLNKLPEDMKQTYVSILSPGTGSSPLSGQTAQPGLHSVYGQDEQTAAGTSSDTDVTGSAAADAAEAAARTSTVSKASDTADGADASGQQYMLSLVKAADKISALIKCMEEEAAGNREFSTAMKSTQQIVQQLCARLPEADIFVREFLPHYGSTLDELLS